MIIYLYIKTHNQTGLKYLGQTCRNPYEYKGSGTYWRKHLQKHGKDISTELIAAFDNKEDLKIAGQFWSKHWNIVQSDEWANLTEEYGDGISGGPMSEDHKALRRHPYGPNGPLSEEHKEKLRLAKLGKRGQQTNAYGHTKTAWNKGLKKENDKRVAKYAQTMKGQTNGFKKGYIPWNKGLKHGQPQQAA